MSDFLAWAAFFKGLAVAFAWVCFVVWAICVLDYLSRIAKALEGAPKDAKLESKEGR